MAGRIQGIRMTATIASPSCNYTYQTPYQATATPISFGLSAVRLGSTSQLTAFSANAGAY